MRMWAAGDTKQTTRDTVQFKFLGEMHELGTGMIQARHILSTTAKAGVPGAVETVTIKHASGGTSILRFKSYDQRRRAFQGTEQDIIWLDEEPPLDIYTECVTRTMTTGGIMILTFTPLLGMSEVVRAFLPGGKLPEEEESEDRKGGKYTVMATWDDAPHLTAADKEELLGEYPLHERDARSKGVPQLGSGAIYPVPEEQLVVPDFQIPEYWPRGYGLDVGWNRTAAVWGALDQDTDVLYLYSEHYVGRAEPVLHAESIKGRGNWIPGFIDPASDAANQLDGRKLLSEYRKLGLVLTKADNTVSAGIHAVWQRMSTGRLKIFQSCQNWLGEYRMYHRDDKGRIVKENDHIMDATRYLVMSGIGRLVTMPAKVYQSGPAMANTDYDMFNHNT